MGRLQAVDKRPFPISRGMLEETKDKIQTFFKDPLSLKFEKTTESHKQLLKKARENLDNPKLTLYEMTKLMLELHNADSDVNRIKTGKTLNIHFPYLGVPPDSKTVFCEVTLKYGIYENRVEIRKAFLQKRIVASENENHILAEGISRVWARLNDLENDVSLMESQNNAIDQRALWEIEKMKSEGTFPTAQREQDELIRELKMGRLNPRDAALSIILTEDELKAVSEILTSDN